MIHHIDIGADPVDRKKRIAKLIRQGLIQFAGYCPGKIYGSLTCSSGKRMQIKNRVFFESEQEAVDAGYRPCGHCMRSKYKEWKNRIG